MELSLTNILKTFLSTIWQMKELLIPFIGLMLLMGVYYLLNTIIKNRKQKEWFSEKKKIKELQNLSPAEFETYIAELFNEMGYVSVVTGGSGDGGIDVEAKKDGKTHYVQCKKFITSKVPVGAVRDFYGAISDKADGGKGYFITTNVFTLDAEKFAEDKPIELVDRFKLMEYMKLANKDVPNAEEKSLNETICPECKGALVERKGKYGAFMGCSNYPKCKYTEKN